MINKIKKYFCKHSWECIYIYKTFADWECKKCKKLKKGYAPFGIKVEMIKENTTNMKLTEEQWSKLNNESKGSHNSANLSDSDFPKQTLSDKYKEYKDWLNEIPEISDEEIEEASEFYKYKINKTFFIEGAKWYREQLKIK